MRQNVLNWFNFFPSRSFTKRSIEESTHSSRYHGPSYRFTGGSRVREGLNPYACYTRGLENNCKPGQKATNHFISKYVNTDSPSPWFGGSYDLEALLNFIKEAHQFRLSQEAQQTQVSFEHLIPKGLVLCIRAASAEGPLVKRLVDPLYYYETGEFNPKAAEREVIHQGGDFGPLVDHIIAAQDIPNALEKRDIPCLLTNTTFNWAQWNEKERLSSSEAAEQRVDLSPRSHTLG